MLYSCCDMNMFAISKSNINTGGCRGNNCIIMLDTVITADFMKTTELTMCSSTQIDNTLGVSRISTFPSFQILCSDGCHGNHVLHTWISQRWFVHNSLIHDVYLTILQNKFVVACRALYETYNTEANVNICVIMHKNDNVTQVWLPWQGKYR